MIYVLMEEMDYLDDCYRKPIFASLSIEKAEEKRKEKLRWYQVVDECKKLLRAEMLQWEEKHPSSAQQEHQWLRERYDRYIAVITKLATEHSVAAEEIISYNAERYYLIERVESDL